MDENDADDGGDDDSNGDGDLMIGGICTYRKCRLCACTNKQTTLTLAV